MTIVDHNADIELSGNPNALFSVDLSAEWKKHKVFLESLHRLGTTALYLDEASLDDVVRRYVQDVRRGDESRNALLLFRGNDQAFLRESLRRYSKLWLPLVARANRDKIAVILPPDAAWMWHCHRLAPYRYSEHMKRLYFGGTNTYNDNSTPSEVVPEASHPFVFQLPTDTNRNRNDTWSLSDRDGTYFEIARHTRELFAELYPEESFFADYESLPSYLDGGTAATQPNNRLLAKIRLLSGFDVIAACQRQATFLWQVSGPNFSKESFVEDGIANYFRFVKLTNHPKRRRPGSSSSNRIQWLVPTYQIDCMWHTHILASIRGYHADVSRITNGAVLDHDDSINDRTEGGVLDTGFQQTVRVWKEVYGMDYFVEGGMYNGEPPAEFYRRDFKCSGSSGVPLAPPQTKTKLYLAKECYNSRDFGSHGLPAWQTESQLPSVTPIADAVAASPTATEWMPNDHAEAFIPYRRDPYGFMKAVNPFKDNYVFGMGDGGLGYYHMNTRRANDVLMNRCDRQINKVKWFIFFTFMLNFIFQAVFAPLFFQGGFLTPLYYQGKALTLDGADRFVFFFLLFSYIGICFVASPIALFRLCMWWRDLAQTKTEADRRSRADGPNGGCSSKIGGNTWTHTGFGNYALYHEDDDKNKEPQENKLPDSAKALLGAAACGFSDIYRPSWEVYEVYGGSCGGGACGTAWGDNVGSHHGGGCGGGGGGCGGGGCGGGGCGGGGCGG